MNNHLFSIVAGVGACFSIGLLTLLESNMTEVALVMAPFGATAVLVFGVPSSPLAQAKNVICGHVLTATIGIVFAQYVGVTPWTLAIATGFGVTAMLVTKTTHPPAGANPMLIMLAGQSWNFLLTPVLVGAVSIVIVGRIMKVIHKPLLGP